MTDENQEVTGEVSETSEATTLTVAAPIAGVVVKEQSLKDACLELNTKLQVFIDSGEASPRQKERIALVTVELNVLADVL